MKKNTLLILILVMASALLGIMLLQITWLSKGVEGSEEAFSIKVQLALDEATKEIRIKEERVLFNEIDNIDVQVKEAPKKQSFSLVKEDPINKQYYVYKQEVLIEKSVVPIKSSNYEKEDSIYVVNNYSSQLKTIIPKISSSQTSRSLSPANYNLLTGNNLILERYVRLKGGATPIEKRVSFELIDSALIKGLEKSKINAEYEFSILRSDSTLTKVTTKRYDKNEETYYSSLFSGMDGKPEYILSIYFPMRDQIIKGPVLGQFILAALLMAIVLSVFGISLYYMIKQRKISEVKTDFINNMTHEFKTPIATINVAVGALKNPLILKDEEKIKYYADLIKQENKRLNSQVEMVLRMSRLRKNQIDLDKRKIDLNRIVSEAIDHIRLIVEARDGVIVEKYIGEDLIVEADEFHLGNVILNVLDNANKYSSESPRIKVKVFEKDNFACVEIKDEGMGMSKTVQKKIFVQFYREETGNIHNIKGHGLGLSYLKKIVDLHNGEIEVYSEKGKGSKFVIKIPL